jgi:tetratricopeptide (TPR) repeat protein
MRKHFYALLIIVFIGLIAYSDTFTVPFQFDDYPNITENPLLKNLGNFFLSPKGYSYNPRRFIGYLTFALNYHFGGLDVLGYHLVNLAVHIVTAVLLYFFVILTFRTPYFRGEGRGTAEAGGQGGSDSRFTIHDSRSFIALFAALLFVSHPVQTQAVTYIVQRFTSLAAMFYLLSVVMYVKGRLVTEKVRGYGRWARGEGQEGKSTGQGAMGKRAVPIAHHLLPLTFFFLSFLSAVLAMMTKEISFTLPIVIVLYEFIFFKTSFRKKLLFLGPLLLTLLIIPISILGTHKPLGEIISDLSEKTRVQTDIPRWDYLMTQIRVITTYVRLLFLPVNQNLDYDYPVFHSLLAPPVLLSFLFLAAIFGTALYLLYKVRGEGQGVTGKNEPPMTRDSTPSPITHDPSPITRDSIPSPITHDPLPITSLYRLISFGILWFFVTLSVESSFIPIADVIFEHRMYLPSAGAFIAISGGASVIAASFKNRSARRNIDAACAVIILFLTIITCARNSLWQDEVRLWRDVVQKSPQKVRPHYDLGLAYDNRGQIAAAFHEYRIALQLDPRDVETHNNLGGIYFQQGRMDEALKEYQTALRYAPGSSTAHYNTGNAYFAMGRLDDAMREYQAALRLNPDDAAAHNNLGGVYLQQGRLDKALLEIKSALKADPEYADARANLGRVLEEMHERGD